MTLDSTSLWSDIKKYEEILTKDPRSYCFAPLAGLYLKLGLVDDAFSVAQKGILLYPEFAAGQMVVGKLLLTKGDKSGAVAAFAKVVSITPDNLDAQKLLSQICIETGDYHTAEQALKIILSLDPNDTESRLQLDSLPVPAALYEDDEIIELTDVILDEELEPSVAAPLSDKAQETPLATATMAELYVQQGFTRQAIGIYQELIAENSANEKYRARLEQLIALQPAAVPEILSAQIQVAPVAAASEAVDAQPELSGRGIIASLEQWLDNVRRVKECRSRIA